PGCEVILSNRFKKFATHMPPGIFRHFLLTRFFTNFLFCFTGRRAILNPGSLTQLAGLPTFPKTGRCQSAVP
ncbi:MAG: hypothetical protein KGH84_10860, partial [Paracoccaceae bacterium]|nr:hypothetical protein [Paracoccaceae bacterium]